MKDYAVTLYDIDGYVVNTIKIIAKDYEQAETKAIAIVNNLSIIYSYSIN